MSLNHCVFMGRLTKEPETRYTQNNVCVASFTIAVNRPYAKDGEQKADFINVVAWNKTAEFVSKYFNKGQQVALHGRIQTRTYNDKDNKKVYVTEVVAEDVYFADGKKAENQPTEPNNEDTGIDELPF